MEMTSSLSILGVTLNNAAQDDIELTISSLFYVCYRLGYFPIEDSVFRFDVGWGCTLRSAQMLMAESIRSFLFGRIPWRPPETEKDIHDHILYKSIPRFFIDCYNRDCTFSIHNMCRISYQFKKGPGDWFGPSECCHILAQLATSDPIIHEKRQLRVLCFENGEIILDEVIKQFESNNNLYTGDNEWIENSVLILLPLRLGLSEVSNSQGRELRYAISRRHFVGMITGYPGHSVYCFGTTDSVMFCLDPHSVQYMDEISKENDRFVDVALTKYTESYHTKRFYKLRYDHMDPTVAIGYLFRNRQDFQDFWADCLIETFDDFSLFSIIEKRDSTDSGEIYEL